ncbi:aromatic amino acid exporter YddG [Hansschlegelia plantiphila]|uniref:Membrane protein n=1 Tax=Hansschlegelia plantiphila TaxID=374655 RepID=A0A9W6J0Y8_9HYPH|nr:EamA family transporter [Hansschlegelia plantiphila]GLK68702.1 membrane protein [Hansschlegelia plantiphila]
MPSSHATAVGLIAILLWSALALLTSATGRTPPFLLTALTFGIGGALGLAVAAFRPGGLGSLRQPWPVWLHGVGGLFGYHLLYFTALKLAPPAEAASICYLWPLLIVLFSAALPGGGLSPRHLAGATLGLGGTAMLIAGRSGGLGFDASHAPGYAAALASAVVWGAYSVGSRWFRAVPTEAVAGFCLATSALAAACHIAFEPAVWPSGATEWLAVAGLGIGPVGAAFFAWDVGMKRGDVALLGVASYACPMISIILLIAAGFTEANAMLLGGCGLIVGGAVVAALGGRRGTSASPAA